MELFCEFQWFGQTWKCVRGPVSDNDGGECNIAIRIITIDEELDLEDFLNTLHHELFEGASFVTGCTFSRDYPDSQDMFVMTHSQMDIISGAVRGAYEEVKRMMATPEKKKVSYSSKKTIKKTN